MINILMVFLLAAMSGSAWAESEKQPAALGVGMRLPPLKGDYLTGRKAALPEAAAGKIALLAFGFTYNSRFAVEDWTKRFRDAVGKDPGVTFYEIPMLGGMARMGRWFIDSGMRKGTPKELHENVITVYGGTGPWKERLRYKQENAAFLILLDRTGTVRWLHAGLFDEVRFKDLVSSVSMIAASPQ
jgi:hypothetical protein